MSQERDIKFAGFAKLLFNEMSQLGLIALADPRNMEGNLDLAIQLQEEMSQLAKQIIAQRAYDLVYHALYYNGVDALYRPGENYHPTIAYERKVTEHTNDIPDLTQWPESSTE